MSQTILKTTTIATAIKMNEKKRGKFFSIIQKRTKDFTGFKDT